MTNSHTSVSREGYKTCASRTAILWVAKFALTKTSSIGAKGCTLCCAGSPRQLSDGRTVTRKYTHSMREMKLHARICYRAGHGEIALLLDGQLPAPPVAVHCVVAIHTASDRVA